MKFAKEDVASEHPENTWAANQVLERVCGGRSDGECAGVGGQEALFMRAFGDQDDEEWD